MEKRALGSMIGGTVGDALGNPVSSYSYEKILSEYGKKGITRYQRNEAGKAMVSDDTQMTLFTANGILLRMSSNVVMGNIDPWEKYVEKAYVEWLSTQQEDGKVAPMRESTCWLMQVKDLYAVRIPDETNLSALRSLEQQGEVNNESYGCGGLMRVAPVGLVAALHPALLDELNTIRLGAEVARITHKHPLGYLPAGMFAHLLRELVTCRLLSKEAMMDALDRGWELLAKVYPKEEASISYLKMIMNRAIYLSTTDLKEIKALERLGEGRIAEEILAIAVYCTLRHWGNFERAIVAAVNHSGESASTGAVTGYLMGAIVGYDSIPQHYQDGLELIDVVQEITMDMIEGFPDLHQGMTPRMSAWIQKYRDALWPVHIVNE